MPSLHVWQLTESQFVGTAHLQMEPSADWVVVLAQAREVFREHGVEYITVQPIVGESPDSPGSPTRSASPTTIACVAHGGVGPLP